MGISAGALLFAFVLFFIISSIIIGKSVNKQCYQAQSQYEGDCVEALIQVVDTGLNTFEQRNYAIWALGQIGDQRALDILKKYLSNDPPPEREPYSRDISQYELKKAINQIESSFNLTKLFWKL